VTIQQGEALMFTSSRQVAALIARAVPENSWRTLFAALLLSVSAVGCLGTASLSASPARVETSDGRFHLTFEMPKATWGTTEALSGSATLSRSDAGTSDQGEAVSGSSSRIVFAYAEIGGGQRHVDPVWPADCLDWSLGGGKSATSTLTKSGGWQPGDPNASFSQAFLTDPQIHLPPGDWTISARAQFYEGSSCDGAAHDLSADVQVHVTA
jgi:hypothetical protein